MSKDNHNIDNLNFKLYNFKTCNDFIDITLSTDELPEYIYDDPKSNVSFDKFFLTLLLEDKDNSNIKKNITLRLITEENDLILLYFRIPFSKYIKKFKSETNLYVSIPKFKKKYKVKTNDSLNLEPNFIFSKKLNIITYPNYTSDNYLYLNSSNFKPFAHTEIASLSPDGILSLEGYHITPYSQTPNIDSISKTVLIKSADNQLSIETPATNTQTPNIHSLYSNLGTNSSWAGFKVDINIKDIIDLSNDKCKLDMYLNLESKNGLKEIVPISINNHKISLREYIDTDSGLSLVHILSNKHKNIKININKYHNEVSVTSSNTLDNLLAIKGLIPKNYTNSKDEAFIVVLNKLTYDEYIIPAYLNGNSFDAILDINELINFDFLNIGIYDLYLQLDGLNYRLTNRLVDLHNSECIQNLHPISADNTIGRTFTAIPYYNSSKDLSILSRPYARTKSISSVSIDNNSVSISGVLEIHTNTTKLSHIAGGYISFNAPYGAKYTLPISWNFIETSNPNEFNFNILIQNKNLIDNDLTPSKLLKYLEFDLVKCMLATENTTTLFSMHISKSAFRPNLKQNETQIDKFANKNGNKLYNLFNKLHPLNKKVAMFQSFNGNEYSCNPRFIYEQCLDSNLDLTYVWVLNDTEISLPGNPIIVKPNSFKYYYYMAIAKYFISNDNLPEFYIKRDGTINLHTGTSFDNKTSIASFSKANYDYFINPKELNYNPIIDSFNYQKSLIKAGYAKNDLLNSKNTDKCTSIKNRLNIPLDKKVILYIPSYIEKNSNLTEEDSIYQFNFNINKFKETFGDEYVILFKLDNNELSKLEIQGYNDILYNVSSINENEELYLISDVLITDCSYSIFSYAILDRPILFFTHDSNIDSYYIEDFYFDFTKELPGPILTNEDDLFDSISNLDNIMEEYKISHNNFKDKFCSFDNGNSSEIIINTIFSK